MKRDTIYLSAIDLRAFLLTIMVTVIMIGTALFFYTNSMDVNTRIQEEDGVLEYLTALFFFVAGVIFIFALTSRRSTAREKLKDYRLLLILLGILCVFAALEEISFGQRLFGWDSPEYFEENSSQEETDFHNFEEISLVFGIAGAVLVLYGLVVPFGLRYSPKKFAWFREFMGIRIPYPPVQSSIILLIGILCIVIDYMMKIVTGERFVANEYQEFFFGYGFLIFSLYLFDVRFQKIMNPGHP